MDQECQLTEIKNALQNEKDIKRRVFRDGENDLVVWYNLQEAIIGFELTLKGVTVTYANNKFNIYDVDRCEKDNYAPILSGSAEIGLSYLIDYIDNHGKAVDRNIVDYIKTVLYKKMQ